LKKETLGIWQPASAECPVRAKILVNYCHGITIWGIVVYNLTPRANRFPGRRFVWMGTPVQVCDKSAGFHLIVELTIIEVLTYNLPTDPLDRHLTARMRLRHAIL